MKMRHISVSLRRATKAKTEVHELQNYRHARHNLKSYSAENKYISTERSVTASLHPHFDAAKLLIFSDTSKSPPPRGIKKIKTVESINRASTILIISDY